MATESAARDPLRTLLALAAAALLVAGLRAAAAILVPIVLAAFFAVLVLPLVHLLERHRVPLSLAITAAMLALFAVLGGFLVLLGGSMGELREFGPRYLREIQERLAYTLEWWGGKGIPLDAWLPERWFDAKAVVNLLGLTVRGGAAFLSQGTLVLLTLVFVLLEAGDFRPRLRRAFGDNPRIDRLARVTRELQRYLWIKTAVSAALGVSVALWIAWMGVDFAVLLGLLAFGCHYVPNIGALLAALPGMLIAFVQHDPLHAILVGLGYLVFGMVLGNLVEPVLMGRRLGLSSLVVFVSLIFWGWVWGAVGMLLSVPLTMTVRIIAEGDADLRWLAVLLESTPKAVAAAPAAEPETPLPGEPPGA